MNELVRYEYNGFNSIFSIKSEYISSVCTRYGNTLKFNYNVTTELLTVFGDHNVILYFQ